MKNSVPDKVLTAPKKLTGNENKSPWVSQPSLRRPLLNLSFFPARSVKMSNQKNLLQPPQKNCSISLLQPLKILSQIRFLLPQKIDRQWEHKSLGFSTFSAVAASGFFAFFSCQGCEDVKSEKPLTAPPKKNCSIRLLQPFKILSQIRLLQPKNNENKSPWAPQPYLGRPLLSFFFLPGGVNASHKNEVLRAPDTALHSYNSSSSNENKVLHFLWSLRHVLPGDVNMSSQKSDLHGDTALTAPKKGRFLQAQKQFLGSLRWFFIKRHLLRGWKTCEKIWRSGSYSPSGVRSNEDQCTENVEIWKCKLYETDHIPLKHCWK